MMRVPFPLPRAASAAIAALTMPQPGHAAATLDGAALSWPWAMPFVGILLTIALGPVVFPRLWSRHYGKFAAAWSALTIGSVALYAGAPTALDTLGHAMLTDYLSFIVLLFALYVVAGGILVTGNLHGTPVGNTGMLFVGICSQASSAPPVPP